MSEGDAKIKATAPVPIVVKPTVPKRERDWLGRLIVPIVVGAIAAAAATAGLQFTTADTDATIKAERQKAIDDFTRDQRQVQYANILQQAARLKNAAEFSSTALISGLTSLGQPLYNNGHGSYSTSSEKNRAVQDAAEGSLSYSQAFENTYGHTYNNPYSSDSSWQSAYTGLDEAISNAIIAGTDTTLNFARALRDRYRRDYAEKIKLDIADIAKSIPDPKPSDDKIFQALVGIPVDPGPPKYDNALTLFTADQLTDMFASAAKAELES